MSDMPDDHREFYALRSRAFTGAPIGRGEFESLFPAAPETTPTIFCSDPGYPSHIAHMGWLLGKRIRLVTPHVAFRYTHADVSHTHTYPDIVSVDPELLDWRQKLFELIREAQIELLPVAQVALDKVSDPIEQWENIETRISLTNLSQPDLVPCEAATIESLPPLTVDLPQLVFADLDLLRKVQTDYPIAAIEFSQMLQACRDASLEDDDSPEKALERIKESVIDPGVAKIQHEYSALLKSQAITTAVEVASVSLALSFAVSPAGFFSQLFGAGVGLIIARGVNQLRKDVGQLTRGPFYAAMKLRM